MWPQILFHLCPHKAGLLHTFEKLPVIALGFGDTLSFQGVIVVWVDHFLCLTSEGSQHATASTIEEPGPSLRVSKNLPNADTPETWAPV